ncbi:MAG: hypothetical protein GC152_07135 [Alphaproteobacteria bacterium]|nr:hypothetical protein [Alphaproteobacteria bacterium]
MISIASSMTVRRIAAICLCLVSGGNAVAAETKPATPLFASDDAIRITIKGPLIEIVRKKARTTDTFPAVMTLEGDAPETFPIELSARGNFRRIGPACQFPPLRVSLAEKPGKASLFHRQNRLKLVTHCRNNDAYQQYVLKEYAAYRLFNRITEASFRVRLADVSYVDDEKGEEIARRMGFFIEDVDDLASRMGMAEVERPKIGKSQLSVEHTVRAIVFQYLIGNLDWSVLSGPEGEDCCHNTKMMAINADADAGIIPLPYDFDHAGLVNAPYAKPPPVTKVRSVRQRQYRGFCEHNDALGSIAGEFVAARGELLGVIDDTPGLDEKTKERSKEYLVEFFDVVADERSFDRKLVRDCRD